MVHILVRLACHLQGRMGRLLLKIVFRYYYHKFCLFLSYYLNKLKATKDYYSTLSALNSNRFCPEGLCQAFIEEVQKQNLMPSRT